MSNGRTRFELAYHFNNQSYIGLGQMTMPALIEMMGKDLENLEREARWHDLDREITVEVKVNDTDMAGRRSA